MFVVVVILEICMFDIEENRNRIIAQFWCRCSLCQFVGQQRDIQRLKVFEMSGAFQTLYSLFNVLMKVMIFTLSQSYENFSKKKGDALSTSDYCCVAAYQNLGFFLRNSK